MQLVIFIGIQATGKSTFYAQRFAKTHLVLSMDMLRTRRRERVLFEACLESKTKCVIDNTNPSKEERASYILGAKEAGFEVIGYFFQSRIQDALARNATRTGRALVPEKGIRAASARLEMPSLEEGFDKLHYVQMTKDDGFDVQDWKG